MVMLRAAPITVPDMPTSRPTRIGAPSASVDSMQGRSSPTWLDHRAERNSLPAPIWIREPGIRRSSGMPRKRTPSSSSMPHQRASRRAAAVSRRRRNWSKADRHEVGEAVSRDGSHAGISMSSQTPSPASVRPRIDR